MANNAVRARAELKIGTADHTLGDYAGDTFTTIGNLVNISGLGGEKPDLPVSNLLSDVVETVGGLVDNGSVEGELHFESENTGHQDFRGAAWGSAADPRNFELDHMIPNPAGAGFVVGVRYHFYGEPKTFVHDWSAGDVAKASISVKINSAVDPTETVV